MGKKNKQGWQQASLDKVQLNTETVKTESLDSEAEQLLDFEEWFSIREASIPKHHHREIIKADFKGRKVPAKATVGQFDEALKKYGIELE